jgi:hypothetical protein
MSPSTLSVIETGKAAVRPLDAVRLGPVLGLDPAELLRAPLPQARQEVPPSRTSLPSRAALVRSFKHIPATCPCDWRMVFEARRPSGWELAGTRAECLHHGSRR